MNNDDERQQKFDLPGTPAEDSPDAKRRPRQIKFYLVLLLLVVVIGAFVVVTALPSGSSP